MKTDKAKKSQPTFAGKVTHDRNLYFLFRSFTIGRIFFSNHLIMWRIDVIWMNLVKMLIK